MLCGAGADRLAACQADQADQQEVAARQPAEAAASARRPTQTYSGDVVERR